MRKIYIVVCSLFLISICIICFILFTDRHSTSHLEIVRVSELYNLVDDESQDDSITDSILYYKEADNKQYDISKKLEEMSNIRIKEFNEEEGVVCEIEAPDVYDFMMDNKEIVIKQSNDETYEFLMAYLDSGEYKTRVSEMTVDATVQDNKLIIDDTSFEFQDAIHGGINSLMTDLVIHALNDMSEEE